MQDFFHQQYHPVEKLAQIEGRMLVKRVVCSGEFFVELVNPASQKPQVLRAKFSNFGISPSSHKHGSVEKGCISNIRFLSFSRVIFH